jgi:osmotically-inducible protein OsmY
MNVLRSHPLMFSAMFSILTTVACTRNDDVELTARAQSHVNEASPTKQEILVNASNGVVTLTGMTTDTARHAGALAAARSTPGVREVIDHISTPAVLTGAKVP